MTSDQLQKLLPIPIKSSFDFIHTVLFQLAIYKEYANVVRTMKETLSFFIPSVEIDYKNKQLIVDDIIITEEI